MPTSSSSSEEDLSIFQSVAVTHEQVISSFKQATQQNKTSSRKRNIKKASAKGDGQAEGAQAIEGDDADQEEEETLDLTSQKIRVALDARLERALSHLLALTSDDAGQAKKEKKEKQRKKNDSAVDNQQQQEASAADGSIRFFSKVEPGVPVILERAEEPAPTPKRRKISARYRVVEVLKDEAVLQALAVDGKQLLQQLQAIAASNCSAVKLPVRGVLLDTTKPFIPYDIRIGKLLGLVHPP